MNHGYALALCGVIAVVGLANGMAEGKAPVAVSIACPASEMKSGSEVRLVITVTNTSDHDVTLYKAPGPDGHAEAVNKIDLRDASGTLRPRIDGQRVLIDGAEHTIPRRWIGRRGFILKPGEKIEDFAVLSSLFDMNKPGKYTVTVRHEMRADDSGPELKLVYVPSNRIMIALTE